MSLTKWNKKYLLISFTFVKNKNTPFSSSLTTISLKHWFGAYKKECLIKGEIYFLDGFEVKNINWYNTDPNDDYCCLRVRETFLWADFQCTSPFQFICKLPKVENGEIWINFCWKIISESSSSLCFSANGRFLKSGIFIFFNLQLFSSIFWNPLPSCHPKFSSFFFMLVFIRPSEGILIKFSSHSIEPIHLVFLLSLWDINPLLLLT